MPQLLTVRVTRPSGRPIRIWIPVVPVVILFSPIVLLVLLAGIVACLMYGISVLRALGGGWRAICALPGSRFGIEIDRTAVLVTIR